MNKQLTLIGIVTLNAAAVVLFIGGCRSTSGYEGEPSRGAVVSSGSGFSMESGNSAFSGPSSNRATVSQSAPPPAAVPTATPVAGEPANPPGAEPVETPSAEPVEKSPAPKTAVKPEETHTSEEPSAVGAGRTYVVKNGDSFWVIARREHVTIDELTAANGLKRNAILRAGQKLVIPASSGKKTSANAGSSSGESHKSSHNASGETYTVVAGDAMSIVARKLHTTTAALRAANPQVKNDNIRIGQKLNVPNGSKAPAGHAAKPAAAKSSAATGAAPVAKPATTPGAKPATTGGLDLPEIAPLGGAPAPVSAPEAVPASTSAPAPEAVEATPVSR